MGKGSQHESIPSSVPFSVSTSRPGVKRQLGSAVFADFLGVDSLTVADFILASNSVSACSNGLLSGERTPAYLPQGLQTQGSGTF